MLTFQEYQALTEQSPILIWRANTETLCDYFNERWLEFRGRTLEQEYGNGWAEGVHPDDKTRCVEIYLTSFEKRQTFEMYYRLMRHDGQYRWILDRGVPFYDDDDQFCGYIGSCIDVTEQCEAEQEKEGIYKATIQGSQHIINNMLQQLQLIKKEIAKHSNFDKRKAENLDAIMIRSKELMQELSSIEDIDAKNIKESVSPK